MGRSLLTFHMEYFYVEEVEKASREDRAATRNSRTYLEVPERNH